MIKGGFAMIYPTWTSVIRRVSLYVTITSQLS